MKHSLYALLAGGLMFRIATMRLGEFQTLIIAFGVLPILDIIIGRDKANSDDDAPIFRWVLYGTVPTQLALLGLGVWRVSTTPLSTAQWADIVLSTGIVTGAIGITAAHELVHRTGRFERGLGDLLLVCVLYVHWGVEHVVGHHTWVGTARDPATSRYGESLYAFLPRTLYGSFVSAWAIERERRKRKSGGTNRVVTGLLIEAALVAVLALINAKAALFFTLQAFTAIILLEIVNYIEHYGLERAPNERVKPKHSWNASERLSNAFLFNLQRHSDHHANPTRRYPVLRHFDDVPQMPTGYAGMLLLALVPPLWFAVMNPRVHQSTS